MHSTHHGWLKDLGSAMFTGSDFTLANMKLRPPSLVMQINLDIVGDGKGSSSTPGMKDGLASYSGTELAVHTVTTSLWLACRLATWPITILSHAG